MSVSKEYYVICGYDITGCQTDKFEDWLWTKEGESFTCYHRKGKIQLFTDPMSGDYLYLGYIFANMDEYNDSGKYGIDYMGIESKFSDVREKLRYLVEIGAVTESVYYCTPEVFMFVECS